MGIENIKSELKTLNEAELHGVISGAILEIKTRAYHEGFDHAVSNGYIAEEQPELSPQQLRDEIVEKAKRDVTYLIEGLMKGDYYVNFVVNREKRTTVALLRYARKYGVHKRGKAKCDATDCFNSHIGEAISLRRALGLEVPSEYLNAPQPTEVRVGDVISGDDGKLIRTIREIDGKLLKTTIDTYVISEVNNTVIIDDSREEVTE